MKKIIFVFSLLLLLALTALPTLATSSGGAFVIDAADLLSQSEEEALSQSYGESKHGTSLYLLTSGRQLSVSEVRSLCLIESGESAAVLVVDRTGGTYYYEMFTFGHVDDVLGSFACDDILDDSSLYSAIKSGRIYDGAARFFALTAARIDRDWYNPGERFGGVAVSIAVGIVTAIIAGGAAALGVYLSYRKKRHGESYPLDRYASLSLTYSDDRFVGSTVTRVRVRSASSSGGGRSGGGGGRSRGRR